LWAYCRRPLQRQFGFGGITRLKEEPIMSSIRSLVVHFVAVASAVAMLTVIAASSALADETKTFTGLKICKPPGVPIQFVPPAPGGYCLITASSLKILLGAKVYLTNATLVAGVLDSPVTLKAIDRRGSTATGHCTYYTAAAYPPGHGLCTYWSGTGKLAGFHATEVAGPPTSLGVSITGTYWFDRDHHGDD
jgi:hypothetical protein